MTFVRASEPFQEPPPRQPHGPWMVGTAVLFLFFVPLLVITAEQHQASPAAKASAPPPSLPVGLPPLPPPGAPWPPPPGSPQPPPCVLGYQTSPDGGLTWIAMTTLVGQLAVRSGPGAEAAGQRIAEPEGVHPVALSSSLARQHALVATLSTGAGRLFACLVGPVRQQPRPLG